MHVGAATRVPGEPAAQSLRNVERLPRGSTIRLPAGRQYVCKRRRQDNRPAAPMHARSRKRAAHGVTTIAAAGGIRGSVFSALRWFQAAACGALARSIVLQRLFRGENAWFRARLHVLRARSGDGDLGVGEDFDGFFSVRLDLVLGGNGVAADNQQIQDRAARFVDAVQLKTGEIDPFELPREVFDNADSHQVRLARSRGSRHASDSFTLTRRFEDERTVATQT